MNSIHMVFYRIRAMDSSHFARGIFLRDFFQLLLIAQGSEPKEATYSFLLSFNTRLHNYIGIYTELISVSIAMSSESDILVSMVLGGCC